MARPREFNEQEVLEAALQVFWERGYAGTSVQELEAATGLCRPSLYAAFGDKAGLFVRALELFQQRYRLFPQLLADAPSVRMGFEQIFDSWFASTCFESGPQGCLLLAAASEKEAAAIPEVRQQLAYATAKMEKLFRQALKRAANAGELRSGKSVTVLARYLTVGLQGLSTAARTGSSLPELRAVKELLLETVFGPADDNP